MKSHPTKVDTWLLVGITAVVALLTALGIDELVNGHNQVKIWVLLPIAGFIAIVFYSFAVYQITPEALVIRSRTYGLKFASIPLRSIRSVRPTRNPLSAPAWSLDRLQIDYTDEAGKRRFTLISPKDREGFMRDLAAVAPHLEWREGSLARRLA